MKISRVKITNFRNFRDLDVEFGPSAVIVGENKVGKSNILFALRLVLDPSLPDSARKLRLEDFWDGLERPLAEDDRIAIAVAHVPGIRRRVDLVSSEAPALGRPHRAGQREEGRSRRSRSW